MAKLIVSGAIANKFQNGGATWTRLNWALGFRKLGFDVYFVEQWTPRTATHRARSAAPEPERWPAVSYFRAVLTQFGLEETAALIDDDGKPYWGMTGQELREVGETAVLLVNITGHLSWEPLLRACRSKVYVDLDPGYTQFWHARGSAGPRLDGHDFYFTVGENIGRTECGIPTCGLPWRPIRQPVVLDEWPAVEPAGLTKFTTVASWRGVYGPVEFAGKTYGLKVHEFRKFIEMPRRLHCPFEIALEIHPAEENDLRLLREHGWRLVDPKAAAGNPRAFRDYVQNSGAEFSSAQGIYVETHSGWFSDRTVRYLASGKPALVQETGFSENLPVGEGLFPFRTLEEAVAGAEAIAADYDKHARAARLLAEEFFDSDKVLGKMLEEIGISP